MTNETDFTGLNSWKLFWSVKCIWMTSSHWNCKTIELIKCNVCMKYEHSTKWVTPGIKENRFITSSLQGPLKPDSKKTEQLIKSTVFNLRSWNFEDWLDMIRSQSCESLKLVRSTEWILLTEKSQKIFLICKIHKKDIIRLKLFQTVYLKVCITWTFSQC